MNSKYFNNRNVSSQQHRVKNRRDADKLIHSSYTAFLLLGIMALRNKFDFGNARIERWLDEMKELEDSYQKGFISVSDLQKTIKEEVGIEIKF